jgi:hypothetical protein
MNNFVMLLPLFIFAIISLSGLLKEIFSVKYYKIIRSRNKDDISSILILDIVRNSSNRISWFDFKF